MCGNLDGYFIHPSDDYEFGLVIVQSDNSKIFTEDSTFDMIDGLNDESGFVSFRSMNYPNYYLRHFNKFVGIHEFEDTVIFKQDASWKQVDAVNGNPNQTSFISVVGDINYYLIHADYDPYFHCDETPLLDDTQWKCYVHPVMVTDALVGLNDLASWYLYDPLALTPTASPTPQALFYAEDVMRTISYDSTSGTVLINDPKVSRDILDNPSALYCGETHRDEPLWAGLLSLDDNLLNALMDIKEADEVGDIMQYIECTEIVFTVVVRFTDPFSIPFEISDDILDVLKQIPLPGATDL